MDDTHDLGERAPDALHAPWRIDEDPDYGVIIRDSRGSAVWFEDSARVPARMREATVARMDAVVLAVNAHADMLAALDRLTREVAGCWGMDESAVRAAIGNTNYNIVVERIEAASAAIAKATGPSP